MADRTDGDEVAVRASEEMDQRRLFGLSHPSLESDADQIEARIARHVAQVLERAYAPA
jgi:hypothetical protein